MRARHPFTRSILASSLLPACLALTACGDDPPAPARPVTPSAPVYVTGRFTGNAWPGWRPVARVRSEYPNLVVNGAVVEVDGRWRLDVSALPGGSEVFVETFKDVDGSDAWSPGDSWTTLNILATNLQAAGFDTGDFAIRSTNVRLLVDGRANTNQRLWLYGTFDATNAGAFATPAFRATGSEPVDQAYELADDGLGDDGVAGNRVFGADVDLVGISATEGYFLCRVAPRPVPGAWLAEFRFDPATNATQRCTVPPAWLPADVTVRFTVLGIYGGQPNVFVYGSAAPLSWSAANVALFDDGTNGDLVAGDAEYTGTAVFTNGAPSYVAYRYHDGDRYDAADWRFAIIDATRATNLLPQDGWE